MKKTLIWLIIVIFVLSVGMIGTACKEEAAETEDPETSEEATEAEEAEPAEEDEEAEPAEEAAAGPVKGGTFVAAIESEPMGLDTHLQQQNVAVAVNDLFYDFLWRWNKDFTEFVPHIASEWEWIDDLNFKVYLRDDVLFHNGRGLVAEDVKYSIDRVLNPETASPLEAFFEPVDEVIVDGDYELTIKLNKPWFGLMDRLTYLGIVPKEAVEEFGDLKTNPVGCGPFVFEEWETGLQITAKRFEDYYMEDLPYVDEVIVKFMPVYSTAKNALLNEEIDIIFWPEPADYESLDGNPDLDLFIYSQLVGMYVSMNTENSPLDDIRVRKAVSLAIDREDFNNGLYMGLGELCWVPILKSQEYYNPDWEYERDIETAKELLADAGYPDGFDIRILAPKGAEEIMGEVLYSNLADIGINGTITALEIPEFLDTLLNKKDFDFAVLGDTISPDPDFFASKYLISDGQMASIVGNWDDENGRIRELLAQGRGELDMAKRVEIYQEVYDIVLEENPIVFVTYGVRLPVFQSYVKDFFAYGDIRYNWQEIWLDK